MFIGELLPLRLNLVAVPAHVRLERDEPALLEGPITAILRHPESVLNNIEIVRCELQDVLAVRFANRASRLVFGMFAEQSCEI